MRKQREHGLKKQLLKIFLPPKLLWEGLLKKKKIMQKHENGMNWQQHKVMQRLWQTLVIFIKMVMV